MLKKLTRTINDQSVRKGAVLLLAWLCLTTNQGLADERQAVDQALPANPLGHVEISLVRGDLALSAWDRA